MTSLRRALSKAIKETGWSVHSENNANSKGSEKVLHKRQDPSTVPVLYKSSSPDLHEGDESEVSAPRRLTKQKIEWAKARRRSRLIAESQLPTTESEAPEVASKQTRSTRSIELKDKWPVKSGPTETHQTQSKIQSKVSEPSPVPAPPPPYELKFSGKARYLSLATRDDTHELISLSPEFGCRTQLVDTDDDVHDVRIGLDFGTSSVKAVVGDATIEKSFAVPFRVAPGIARYLLPCKLWETRDRGGMKFSLIDGKESFNDLKLSVLADPSNDKRVMEVVSFIALVLKHVRAWLFTEHADIYGYTSIYWTVAIGLPSESQVNNELTPVFERIVRLAWQASQQAEVRRTFVKSLLVQDKGTLDDINISVMPELAAQIHGFVSSPSASFDRNRANRYAIVDVGAGTVDSSVFQVRQNKGLWSFTYYTAVVQPNGVANLHSSRIDWWINALSSIRRARPVISDMRIDQFRSDLEQQIPDEYGKYVENIAVLPGEGFQSPDDAFFRKRFLRQVSSQTLYRCWKNQLLEKTDIEGMPIFLCGGGSRMDFYQRLLSVIQSTEGTTWLRLDPWVLTLPTDLICEGVKEIDYDRLSVAYGLSRLHLGEINTALPLPQEHENRQVTYQDRYIDKDQV